MNIRRGLAFTFLGDLLGCCFQELDDVVSAIERTGLLRGGRLGRTYFTTDQFESAGKALSRLALRYPPEYRVEFKILNQPRMHGPRRVRPWFWPRDPGFRAGWIVEFWTTDPGGVKILRMERLR